jgi:hypothetical protein
LTENIPPVPPAPPHPHANWPQPGQGSYPSHGPDGPIPGNEPPYGPPQPYTPPGYGQQPYPPQQYTVPQWQLAAPAKAKSSGYRVAAGIVEIVLGTWLLIPSIAGFSNGSSTAFMAFLVLVAALGNIAAGIVLLANQRGRGQGSPITSLSFAGFALFLGLIGLAVTYFGAALFVSALLLATPVLIVMGIGLSREKRGA